MIDNDIAVVEFLENEKFKEKKRKKRTVSKQSQIPVGIKKSKNESTNIETLEIETMEEGRVIFFLFVNSIFNFVYF